MFTEVFEQRGDEGTADCVGIAHVANRLMDHHKQVLCLAERCCDSETPSRYSGLMHAYRQLFTIALDGYDAFDDDFVEFSTQMRVMVRYARETVEADPISFHVYVVDNRLTKWITGSSQLRV